jgi:hypothetical protein
MRREIALRIDGGGDGILRPPEGDEERITLRVDLASAVSGECRAEDALVLGERVTV